MKRLSIPLATLALFAFACRCHAGDFVAILAPSQPLEAVMSGAPATTQPMFSVEWIGDTGKPSNPVGSLTGGTDKVLLAAPASGLRYVRSVSIYNADTAAVVVTVKKTQSTEFTLYKTTLQVGDTLVLTGEGAKVLDTSGQVKQTADSTATGALAITPYQWRVHDAVGTNLPTTAAADDLGLVNGTDGTAFASLQTIDFGTTTASALGRAFVALPSNYVAGSAITIRVRAGMITTVSDGTATVDLSVYSNDGDATGSADLCETAAQSINSLTFANKDFSITPTGLVAGQVLNVKLTVAGSDTGTGPAVIGAVAHVELRCPVSQ